MKNFILVLLLTSTSFYVSAQKYDTIDDLNFYADIIANAMNPDHKQRAQESFSILLDEWLHSEAYNEADLESLQWISVKSPEDESFIVITWPLNKDQNDNTYFGYIIKDKKIFKLQNTEDHSDLEYDVLSHEEWAGALYYNILTVNRGEEKIYVLFGFNAYKNYESRKIAETLTFEDGQPVFGTELFRKKAPGERGVIKNRIVLDYASDSNASLNYNPGLDMVVFDHLIPRMGRIAGQGPTMLPDGSYVGYAWDGEYFNYIDKIYNQTQDTPPFPKPVLNQDSRNIMGQNSKPKKKRN